MTPQLLTTIALAATAVILGATIAWSSLPKGADWRELGIDGARERIADAERRRAL